MCAVCLHFWCHSTGHAASPTLQSHNQSFQWCQMSSSSFSSSKQVTICKWTWTPLNFSNSPRPKTGGKWTDEMFRTAAAEEVKAASWPLGECWSGNSSHHQGFRGDEANMINVCSNFLTDLQQAWHFRENYELTGGIGGGVVHTASKVLLCLHHQRQLCKFMRSVDLHIWKWVFHQQKLHFSKTLKAVESSF